MAKSTADRIWCLFPNGRWSSISLYHPVVVLAQQRRVDAAEVEDGRDGQVRHEARSYWCASAMADCVILYDLVWNPAVEDKMLELQARLATAFGMSSNAGW